MAKRLSLDPLKSLIPSNFSTQSQLPSGSNFPTYPLGSQGGFQLGFCKVMPSNSAVSPIKKPVT